MKEKAFLSALKDTPRTWSLDYRGYLRDEAGRCPLQAVADVDFSNKCLSARAMQLHALNIPSKLQDDIVRAADNSKYCRRALRRKMMDSCTPL